MRIVNASEFNTPALSSRLSPKVKRIRTASGEEKFEKTKPGRVKWTDAETDALEEGMMSHGTDWAGIRRENMHLLGNRLPMHLKDRARNVSDNVSGMACPQGSFL
jgi:hypothetical protein